jgi:hypothetical protein
MNNWIRAFILFAALWGFVAATLQVDCEANPELCGGVRGALCDTDTDCAEKFGGDGGPEPEVKR